MIYSIFWGVAILFPGANQNSLFPSTFESTQWNVSFHLRIYPDSTFSYCKKYDYCIEESYGKVTIEGKLLHLNSTGDILPNGARKITKSKYVEFIDHSFRIKKKALIDMNSKRKYLRSKRKK